MNEEFYKYVVKKLNIVDVIKSYISLELDEDFYYGYCPFHGKKGQKLPF